jgi:Protein kinase domain
MADLSGREVGGCRLIRPVGIGGMGEVYLAEQTRLGHRQVAVKVVQLDSDALTPDMVKDVERRFRREAALLGSFSHPNILPVHDAGVQDGLLYLVMEYVPDGSLSDAIRPGPAQKLALPLVATRATDLIGQMAAALQYTHDRGVVHRDVKPGNMLVRRTPDGGWQLLLADFGIARAMQEATQRTQVTGTFAYMAPEQFSGTFSPASDQYALAVVAYQLLTGRTPFQGDLGTVTQAHLNEPPPPMRTINPTISPALDAVILRALAKDPADRNPSVTAFAQALREAVGLTAGASASAFAGAQKPSARKTPTVPWPLPGEERPRNRRPGLARAWIAVIAAVVLLVGAVGGTGLLRTHFQQLDAQATQTAAAQTTASASALATTPSGGTGTAQVSATQTAAAVIATATAGAFIPTATATAAASTDVTAPPPAPSAANQVVFADVSPTCHGGNPIYPPWTIANNTAPSCPASGGVQIQIQNAGSLACIEQHSASILPSAYISVLVTPGSNSGAILGFRQGQVSAGAGTFAGVGYYFKVARSDTSYQVYQFDSATHQTILASGALSATPAADFALGVLAQGKQITLYVNGQPIAGPITDDTHTSGWASLCTEGSAVFRDFQVYTLNG